MDSSSLNLSDQDRQRLLLAQAQNAARILSAANVQNQAQAQAQALMSNPMAAAAAAAANNQLAALAAVGGNSLNNPLNALAAANHPNFLTNTYKRRNATKENTAPLKEWLRNNEKNPYPSKNEKMMLAVIGGMSLTQVSTWFANARRRMKKELPGVSMNSSSNSHEISKNSSSGSNEEELNQKKSEESSSQAEALPTLVSIESESAKKSVETKPANNTTTTVNKPTSNPISQNGQPLNTSISTVSNSSANTSGAPSGGRSDPPSPNNETLQSQLNNFLNSRNLQAQNNNNNNNNNTSNSNNNNSLLNLIQQAAGQNNQALNLQRQLEELQKRQLQAHLEQQQLQQVAALQQAQAVVAQQQQQQAQVRAILSSPLKRKQTTPENLSLLPPLPKLQKIEASPISPTKKSPAPQISQLLSSTRNNNNTANNPGSHPMPETTQINKSLTEEDELEVVVDDEISDDKAGESIRNKEHTVSIGSVNPVHMTVKANKIWSIADML